MYMGVMGVMGGSDLESEEETDDEEPESAPERVTGNKQPASAPPDRLLSQQAEKVGEASNLQIQLLSLSEDEGAKLLPPSKAGAAKSSTKAVRQLKWKECHPSK